MYSGVSTTGPGIGERTLQVYKLNLASLVTEPHWSRARFVRVYGSINWTPAGLAVWKLQAASLQACKLDR